jgi:hypothetical protein
MILNHTTGEYFVSRKENSAVSLCFFDAGPSWVADKLKIDTRHTDSLSYVADMLFGRVVEKVNGLPTASFTSVCNPLNWRLSFSGKAIPRRAVVESYTRLSNCLMPPLQ